MDIAVSILTICEVSAKVIKLGLSYSKAAGGLSEDVQTLLSEMGLLSKVLNSVAANLMNGKDGPMEYLEALVRECRKHLDELCKFLEKSQAATGSTPSVIGRRFRWPLKEGETKGWVNRIERYKSTFMLALKTEEIGLAQKISEDLEDIKRGQEIERLEKKRTKQSKSYAEAISWLSKAEPQENFFAARKLHQPGTGTWFTTSKSFQEWKGESSSFLWLYGSAGTGKTILSSHIINHLLEEQGTNSHIIYFFCDFRDVSAVAPREIYGSLVAQLIQSNWGRELPVDFQRYFERQNKKPPLMEALKEQLKKLLAQAGSTRIVIDALDECDGLARTELLGTLLDFQRSSSVNLLVTSREEADIKFLVSNETTVCIRPESNSGDIELFVREETERNRKLSGLKNSTKAEIFSEISTQASGMFRWAKCSLDQICRLRNDKAIKAALRSLPPGLSETYERILDNIPEEDQELAFRIFQWLVSALRPMRIREIIEAVAVELRSGRLDPDTLLNDPEDLLDICGSMVTIDREHGTIGLAHLSVKEFFISSARQNGRHPKFFVKLDQAKIEVAKVCLTYLCFEDFSAGPCQTQEDFKARLDSYALYSHASTYWHEYAQNHRDMEDEPYLAMIEVLFLDQKKAGNFDSWLQAYEALKSGTRSHDDYQRWDIQGDNRLVYACRLGLHSVVQFLLGKGIDPNGISTSRGGEKSLAYPFIGPCGNALNAACEARNLELVKLVHEAGADLNCLAGRHGTALIAAVRRNYNNALSDAETSKIIEYLVEQGADINRRNAEGEFPLESAVLSNCRPDIVSLLLELGADLGMRDLSGYTVTESAGGAGLGEIFLLLLDAGGLNYLPDEKNWRFSSPPDADAHAIHWAVGPNLFEVAERVLEKASKNLFEEYKDLMYNTFRHCAKFGYYMYLQTLLVHSGAPFPGYEDCLREACVRGYKETVKVMIDALPPSTKATDIPGSPLIYAAAKGHEQVVKFLLETGTDASATDEHGWSAILTAAQYKYHNILEMFNPSEKQLLDLRMRPLRPSSLQPFVYEYIGKMAPVGLTVEGTSAHLLPESKNHYTVYFDHPITPHSNIYYFEIAILELGNEPRMEIGLTSALAQYMVPYDYRMNIPLAGGTNLGYTNTGMIGSANLKVTDFPTYSVGSVVGCAVDFEKGTARFTCDGRLINAACRGVSGMINGAVFLSPGTRVKANFGNEPFVFDMANLETMEELRTEFEFKPDKGPGYFSSRRDPRYIG